MLIKCQLDGDTYRCLSETAIRDLRSPERQAEVILRRALGLPVPKEDKATAREFVPTEASDE